MFELVWTSEAEKIFRKLENSARKAEEHRLLKGKTKSSLHEGLFNQVVKTVKLLSNDPKHPGLNTHRYHSLEHPWSSNDKVFESYVQNNTPGAYRIFWCYGPNTKEITVVSITPHP